MEELRDSFNKLLQKTLTMEDPRLTKHSPQYSSNEEDIETDKNLATEELEKKKISLSRLKTKLWIDVELNTLPLG